MKIKPRLKRLLSHSSNLSTLEKLLMSDSLPILGVPLKSQNALTIVSTQTSRVPLTLLDNIFYFSKSFSTPILFKYLITKQHNSMPSNFLNKNFFKTVTSLYNSKQLNSLTFASRKQFLTKSNLQPLIRTHASIKKHVFYRLLDSTFTVNVIY